jgi:outer membrane protein OmpA-like peptidoglycan-associated protein
MIACVYMYINQDRFGNKTFHTPSISKKIDIPKQVEEKVDENKVETTTTVETPATPIADEPTANEDEKIQSNIQENVNTEEKQVEEDTKPQIDGEDISAPKEKEVVNTPNTVIPQDKKIEELSKRIQPKNTQANITQNTKAQKEIDDIVSKDKIFFKRLGTDITDKSYKVVKQIANILLENKDVKIEIGGHTDAKGEADVNQWISLQRAKSVKKELEKLGVSKDRITAKGYGETQPLVPNDKNGYSSENRRVEFKIIEE